MNFYVNLNIKVRKHPKFCKWMMIVNRAIMVYMVACFALICLYMIVVRDFGMLAKTLIFSALGFACVTLLRSIIKRSRPYVEYGYQPIFPKESKCDSFPSRHTYSAAVIALSAFQISPCLFAVSIVLAMMLAVFRVLGGVHRISDVTSALLMALAFGLAFFI